MKYQILKIVVVMLFFLAPFKVSAATLYFNSPKTDYVVGEQFTANILVDSLSEGINAFEGRLVFPADLVEVKDIFTGNSVINLWVEPPQIKNNEIKFSGIVPGGYQGDKGLIFSTVFLVKAPGRGTIELADYKLLLNDGQGTSAQVSISDLAIIITPAKQGAPAPEYLPFPDGTSPEEFIPELSRSPDEFNNQWFVVFATQDKGSGIDYYEVCEGNQNNCERAESPYVLRNQNNPGKIFIKAMDKRGNGRLMVLEPPTRPVWYEKYEFYVILFLILVASFLLAIKKYVRRV